MLTQQQINEIRAKSGLEPLGSDKKTSTENSVGKFDYLKPTGLMADIKSDLYKRGESIRSSITGKGGMRESLNIAGQAAGGVWDVAGRVVGSAFEKGTTELSKHISGTPSRIEEDIKTTGIAFLESPTGKMAVSAVKGGIGLYSSFKEKYPKAARDFENIVNIASVLPLGRGGALAVEKTGEKIGAKAGIAGRALEASGLQALPIEKQKFVRELVSPIKTKAVKEAQVSRTTETGKGIFKKSIIAPTAQELKTEAAVMKIEGIDSGKTFQQNFNIIQEANIKEAQLLEKNILANDFMISKKEVISRLNSIKTTLAESPTIVGDAQKTAEKLLAKAIQIVNENKGSGSGILKARKQYDNWVLSQKPKAFDATSENAFSLANREVRDTLNTILDEKVINVAVKDSLANQHSLYNALDIIRDKAALEADSAFGRLMQTTGKLLGTKSRIVQGIAAAVGIGGLGAAATFAPPVAIAGGIGLLIYSGRKLILNPRVRIQIGKLLQELEKTLPTKSNKASLDLIKEEATKLLNYE